MRFRSLGVAVFFTIFSGSIAAAAPAGSDELGKLQINITSKNSDIVIDKTLGDVRAVFQNYQPAVDGSTKIKSPVQVSGSSTRPFMEVTMEKCVLFICQTVNMKADISVKDVSGKCTKNFILRADLTRSSEILANVYDSLDVAVCYQRSTDGQGTLIFMGSAHHAPGYSGGPVQNEIYQLLKLQIDPIGAATKKVLKIYGATL